ncbi:hypothetical protein KOI35_14975 [Actinoplanes bogorensis]|uniref:Uncharacterized protein n=1 Tax=Paractinoplanes bogorensis TaxID=1610840 RepID=A0ABS5YQ10_9ACTN|nr:hypothetical protein [Actinoplanes bogorensis]MBU2664803.1 hypothetical protein [Actinoplanes bogorensis]
MFSQAQYEAVIQEIDSGMTTFQAKLGEVVPTANAAMSSPFIPPPVAQGFKWIAEQTVKIGTEILEWFKDLLKGVAAPVYLFIDAWHWMEIKGVANGVSTDLSGAALVVDDSDWSGKARDAYLSVAGAHSAAAARVGSIANGTSVNLMVSATAGLAFYTTLAAVLAKLISALVVSIAAMGSGIFSGPGIALFLEEAGVNTALIWGAVATLGTFLGSQATALITLHGEAVDPTSFPNGAWPRTDTGLYSDATVKDGDADWSLKGA